ncbi:hypothetical protein BCR42DRAFT_437123 [Absidia repens]|uniref:Uncharacterized protein n=1 Tax=Absidia repens TaxID=90262 RepID=A0A1X2II35_9FUNG|nr:hypothetical protein BCR42DRAFT_437123 [Absidia repens]
MLWWMLSKKQNVGGQTNRTSSFAVNVRGKVRAILKFVYSATDTNDNNAVLLMTIYHWGVTLIIRCLYRPMDPGQMLTW